MNSKQKIQTMYFDNGKWLNEIHQMSAKWHKRTDNSYEKHCCRCEGTVIIDKLGRVGGNLAGRCDEQRKPIFEDQDDQVTARQIDMFGIIG